MRVLVTGGSGAVGYRLCQRFLHDGHEVHFTFNSHPCAIGSAEAHKIDITMPGALGALCALHFDVIVHAAALTNVDLCETDYALAKRHNVLGTENAADLARLCGAPIVFISTSHVFQPSEKPYTEHEIPTKAPNNYGQTKLDAEKIVSRSGLDFIILRIDQPYYWTAPWHRDNTVTRTLRKLNAGQKVQEVADWFNNPTFIPKFCDLACSLLDMEKYGLYHAAGPDYISRFQWAREVCGIFGFEQNAVEPISSESFRLPVKRPNVRLDSSRVFSMLGMEQIGVAAALKEMKDEKWKSVYC